jgi:hypothetical protein
VFNLSVTNILVKGINAFRSINPQALLAHDLFAIFFLYAISHGAIFLLLNAVFWDDWILLMANPEIVVDMFVQQAATLFYLEGHLHVFLLKIGLWLYKLSTFFMMAGAGYFLYSILKKYRQITDELRFFIVLFFLTFPYYSARVSIINYRYTV